MTPASCVRPAGVVAAAAAAATVALVAACGDPLAPLPAGGAPRALRYETSGFAVTTYSVSVAGDTVVLVTRNAAGPTLTARVSRRVPSADEWRAFWRAASAAGVRRWPTECTNPNVVDGGGAEYEVAWAGGRLAGRYFNAYPTRAGRCSGDDAADAERFRAAVFAVAGADPAGA